MCTQKFSFRPPTLNYQNWTQWSCTIQRSPPPPPPALRPRPRRSLGWLRPSRSAFPWLLGGRGACAWCGGAACCARQSACGRAGTGRASRPCGPAGGAAARPPPWNVWRRWGRQSSSGLCGCACVSVERRGQCCSQERTNRDQDSIKTGDIMFIDIISIYIYYMTTIKRCPFVPWKKNVYHNINNRSKIRNVATANSMLASSPEERVMFWWCEAIINAAYTARPWKY